VIQFGLAIAGWGGWRAFFADPALRALAWVTAGLAGLLMGSDGDARKLSSCVRPGWGIQEQLIKCWLVAGGDDRSVIGIGTESGMNGPVKHEKLIS
jgi:hypothetical protein